MCLLVARHFSSISPSVLGQSVGGVRFVFFHVSFNVFVGLLGQSVGGVR